MICMVFILVNPFRYLFCPVDRAELSRNLPRPLRIELFDRRVKVIRQKKCVSIYTWTPTSMAQQDSTLISHTSVDSVFQLKPPLWNAFWISTSFTSRIFRCALLGEGLSFIFHLSLCHVLCCEIFFCLMLSVLIHKSRKIFYGVGRCFFSFIASTMKYLIL